MLQTKIFFYKMCKLFLIAIKNKKSIGKCKLFTVYFDPIFFVCLVLQSYQKGLASMVE
ncbi:hypothetical protein CLU79DRAFT_865200 [Phycomyces nitens]|nr:hypothetical protein CLU79DRAFT_865200 [Phycomyces nitens]